MKVIEWKFIFLGQILSVPILTSAQSGHQKYQVKKT